jgi:uncharacterized protein YggU (UPF0235/DUF167 family)
MAAEAVALPPWLRGAPGGWRLSLWVQPGAARTEAAGEHDGCLKLRIAASPIDGRANEAVRRFVAERLGIAREAVRIEHGASSRRKRVRVESGLGADALRASIEG